MKNKNKPQYSMLRCIQFMLRCAWDAKRQVVFLCVLVILCNVGINLIQLYISPTILKVLENKEPLHKLVWTIAIFSFALIFLRGSNAYLSTIDMYPRVEVRVSIVGKIVEKSGSTSYPNTLDPVFIKKKGKSQSSTAGNDRATEYIWITLTKLFTNVLSFIAYLVLLTCMNWFLVAVVLLITIVGFLINHHINMWSYRHSDEEEACHRDAGYISAQLTSGTLAKDVRLLGLHDWLSSLWGKCLRALDAYATRREKTYIWINILNVILSFARNGIAYAYLISMTLKQGWAVSEFLLYFAAFTGFTTWVTGIMQEFSTLHLFCLDLSIVQEYLNFPELFQFEGGETPKAADSYELKLENVSFRYPGADQYIFRNLNMTVHGGEKLAIVGLNGSGKSTIVKLLCGLYDPDDGRVLLNGVDIRHFDRRKYYELISAVFQDSSNMDVTIGENVSQTVGVIDTKQVSDAIREAGLEDVIQKLPNGFHTPIGRDVFLDGTLLSGGQMQRLMLARALYKNAPILVLDEPTAAMDPLAEHDIYMKYNEMTFGKTSVFISHRLASTRFCDRIIYLADGTIQEEGTHEQLLKQNGGYAQLFEVQSRYYQEEGEHYAEN